MESVQAFFIIIDEQAFYISMDRDKGHHVAGSRGINLYAKLKDFFNRE